MTSTAGIHKCPSVENFMIASIPLEMVCFNCESSLTFVASMESPKATQTGDSTRTADIQKMPRESPSSLPKRFEI